MNDNEPEHIEDEQFSVYISGRWSRREELLQFSFRLHDLGWAITSSWLWAEEQGDEEDESYWGKYALRDLRDIADADAFILFTEIGPIARNSRLVEFGAALATGKEVVIIGPRENIFCCLPCVHHCQTEADFWAELDDSDSDS